jgi:polyphosphate kinase
MPKRPSAPSLPRPLGHHAYHKALTKLQIELVKLQRHVIERGERVLVIFEGRDAAGKDGTIKHITEHLSPRETRVVALGPPTDRDRHSWYFQRYVRYLPASGEMVLFNRSWYNRAGVERVMGFCTKAETRAFLKAAPRFEEMLAESGIKLLKYYLDISRPEQKRRLKERAKDPLKQWKLSPIDAKAVKLWRDYSKARDEMLLRTHSAAAPWTIVRADDKEHARLNVIRDLLWRLPCPDRNPHLALPNPNIVFPFDAGDLENGMIAP